MKRWQIGDIHDFDVFCNLKKSGIEINVTSEPHQMIENGGKVYQYVGHRWVEARTTTEEQEILLLLSCNKVTLIEEKHGNYCKT